jgi:predicted AAA+ superfamily ATPase
LASLRPDLTINLASPSTFRDYVTYPERLEAELNALPKDQPGQTVFIDEIQRVPQLLDLVQVLIDQHPKRFRFLLSGSSARKLRKGQANLLPGRIHVHYLHPLLIHELSREFDLDRVLAHGTLPGIYAEADPEIRAADLRAYTDIYLREEIQAEALVRNVGGYARLLEHVAAASGRILNLNALCGDAGIRYETARRYIDVLEDTLVAFRIPAWSGSDKGKLIAHPKIYLFDLGVRNALLHRPLDRPQADERGLLFEQLVAHELHRRLGTLWPQAQLYHYRTRHGLEVDFVLQIGNELWGIEVKASRNVPAKALSSLQALSDRVPAVRRRIVVFLGERKQLRETVEALPLHRFLDELPA